MRKRRALEMNGFQPIEIWKRVLLNVRIPVLLFVFLFPCMAQSHSNLIRTDAPGNTFIAGQEVTLILDAALLGKPIRVVDYWGRWIASKEKVSGSEISLGSLSTGWYTVCIGDEETALAVVPDPKERIESNSNVCADVALSWLIPPERFEEASELLFRAGIRTIRDRFSWSEVEPEPNVFKWGRYDSSASILKNHGIKVYTVFHDTPAWTRTNKKETFFPDDLRDAYRFMKETGKHYAGSVDIWEIWNEADIPMFSPTTGSDYSAYLKAVSLGLKDGNPKSTILMNSLALASGKWLDQVLRDGGGNYFDLYNYHIYADPVRDYASRAQWHKSRMAQWGIADKPIWLTEAGIPSPHRDGIMALEAQQRQVQFIPKAYVMSLATGVDKYFFFVVPWLLEEKNSWGVWHGKTDLTPYPGYSALSAAAWMLGWGHYVGRLDLADEAVHVHLLKRSPTEEEYVLVLWCEGPSKEIVLPESLLSSANRVVDAVGFQTQFTSRQRAGHFYCSETPVYIPLHLDRLPDSLKRPASRPGNERPPVAPGLPRVVLRVSAPSGKIDKKQECVTISSLDNVTLNIEIYNFYDREISGNLAVYHFGVSPQPIQNMKIDVPSYERLVREVKLPASLTGSFHTFQAALEENGQYSTPASIDLMVIGEKY